MEDSINKIIDAGLPHVNGSAGTDRYESTGVPDAESPKGMVFNTDNVDTSPSVNTRKKQKITFLSLKDRTYGESDFSVVAIASSGLTVSFTVSGSCSISGNIVHILRAGACTVTAHQDGDDNFDPALDVSQSFTVNPATLNVTADHKSTIYGSSLPAFSATISGLVDNIESLGKLTFQVNAVQGSPAGTYNITPAGLSSPNYTFNYVSGTLTILPAPLIVKAEDRDISYGEALPAFNAVISGLVNGDAVDCLGRISFETKAVVGSPVGNYTVIPEDLYSPNYEIEYIDGTLNIQPASLLVKVEDVDIVYGDPLPEFHAEASGLAAGDKIEDLGKLEFQTAAVAGSSAGTYIIAANGLSSPNYEIEYGNGTLHIQSATLMVRTDDISVPYGAELPEFSSTILGLVNGDTIESLGSVTYNTTARKGSPVGTYPVTPDGLISPNYICSYVAGNLTVTPVPLTVKADDKQIVSGEALPEYTASLSGLVNDDAMNSLGKLSFHSNAKPKSPVGVYPIIPEGFTSENYTYNYVSGNLEIIPVPSKKSKKQPDKAEKNKKDTNDVSAEDKQLVPGEDLEEDKPRLGEILVQEGKISKEDLVDALSKQLSVPAIDINTFQIERDSLKLVSETVARQFKVVPLAIRNGYLLVAMSDPSNIMAIETLTAQSKMRIKPVIALPDDIQKAIDRNYKSLGELEKQFADSKFQTQVKSTLFDESIAEAPAVKALEIIVEEAVKNRASDIHIEPQEERVRIRYRIDGVLHEVSFLPLSAHGPLISRLKVLSEMNIADHRPADGQFSLKIWNKDIDIRVATVPTAYGEMATLRILDKSYALRNLKDIGFSPDNLELFKKMLKSPHGMILVSGPTGSGKTTTLYAAINSLDCKETKIITIEDPVEYHFEGINQIQVNTKGGLTFADGIRSIMRHDPDVALVGEVRDRDTSSVAVQAAMTGHLVLASVHANDTVGVIFRLVDLGVEPFLLASALIGVEAQRMVRRVCPNCREEVTAPVEYQAAYYEETGEHREKFYYGKGCEACSNTGFLGRTAVMEMLTVSDEIRRMILNGAGTTEIREQAIKEGMVSIRHDGMLKVREGITTPNEVLRNVFSI